MRYVEESSEAADRRDLWDAANRCDLNGAAFRRATRQSWPRLMLSSHTLSVASLVKET